MGLTGSIGSGKSTAANCFQQLGFKIISADQLARDVVLVGEPAYCQIVNIFGKEILQPDESINRAKLANIVFNNENALKQLNTITHSEIRKLRKIKVNDLFHLNPETNVISDIPLLFETKMQSFFQKVILVTIDYNIQLKRLIEYRKLDIEDVKSRLQNQMPQIEKIKLADIIIENNMTLAELKLKVKSVQKKILELPSLELKNIKL